ncbi:MAG: SUMF1/EgtB/PvdO family nonheme iron enzyme [Candidatus Sericytochromatia bacterium]|nr:SUMF1/EgtB/PvdO family nonheme iron enzyme [Candidatus Sericytochromatia bacterium]
MLCQGVDLTGSNRVNRGGSWNNNARNARSAYRNNNTPDNRNNNLGFRLVRGQSKPVKPYSRMRLPCALMTRSASCVGLAEQISRSSAASNPG